MIQQVSEKQLAYQVRELAKRTRKEILDAGLDLNDFDDITKKYGIKLAWQEMPILFDGHYSKDLRTITLNSAVTNLERQNFNFCHEFLHDRIDRNDDLYEQIHEFAAQFRDDTFMDKVIERLCNTGAAELLMPSEEVRQLMLEKVFSTALIPELSERFGASSIAVAFQMLNHALHDCYLVIAEARFVRPAISNNSSPLLDIKPISSLQQQLIIIRSGGSPASKYPMARNIPIQLGHLMYTVLRREGDIIKGQDDIPRRNSRKEPWIVDCEALYFRGKVFAFFNVSQPANDLQMQLL